MRRLFSALVSIVLPVGMALPCNDAVAQLSLVDAKGYFYAPTPCELVESGGDFCSSVTVPLSANFTLETISTTTKKRSVAYRGTSNMQGYFSIKVPRGTYKLSVRGVSYRVLGGGRQMVGVPMVPAQSEISFPHRAGKTLQIPLVRVGR